MKHQTPTTPHNTQYITANQAAQQIGVSPSYIWRMCRQGRIAGAFKIANVWVMTPQALDEFNRTRK